MWAWSARAMGAILLRTMGPRREQQHRAGVGRDRVARAERFPGGQRCSGRLASRLRLGRAANLVGRSRRVGKSSAPRPLAPAHGDVNGPSPLPTDQQVLVGGDLSYGAARADRVRWPNRASPPSGARAALVRALIWRWQAVFLACVLAGAAVVLALTSKLTGPALQPVRRSDGSVPAHGTLASLTTQCHPWPSASCFVLTPALERMAKQVRQQTDTLREQAPAVDLSLRSQRRAGPHPRPRRIRSDRC